MEPKEILEKLGVLKRGHFLLTSGNHSDIYFEKYRILSRPTYLKKILEFSYDFLKEIDFEVVVGPFTGGAIIATILALLLDKKAVFVEKENDKFVIRRDFLIEPGSSCIVVDDVITTGGSITKTIKACENILKVKGILVIIDRREKEEDFEVPFYAIYKQKATIFSPQECPLCKNNIPLEIPGGKGKAI
ncbi:MAG: phosphoribosyltransferase family protein [Candidatus Hydrothermales bacterium]